MKKPWIYFLLLLIAIVVAFQARFLFVFPVPDTGMWFGDESWTMLTLRALARTGVARVPEAIGSSLAHSNGFVNGCVWISGLIYGLPAVIFSSIADPVSIGRAVTFVVSIITLFLCYVVSKRFSIPSLAALLGILMLVLSPDFYFSSHSARLDMVTGFAVLLYFYFLIAIVRRKEHRSASWMELFWISLTAVLSLSIYVHVPALLVLPVSYSLIRFGVFRSGRMMLASLTGILAGSIILIGAYWFTSGPISLLGSGYNQYYNVANSLPVLHLTSWRVQKINTIDRAIQVWDVAWPIVILLAVGIIYRSRSGIKFTSVERFFSINVLLLIIGWGLFGGPAVFYNIHILPIVAVWCAMLIAPAFARTMPAWTTGIVVLVILVFVVIVIYSQNSQGLVGKKLTLSNDVAVESLLWPIGPEENPPPILTDEPAEHLLAGNPKVRLMTNHLLLFGEWNKSVPEVLKENHVNYLLLYSCNAWHSPFQQIADSLYQPLSEQVGNLTDLGRTYDSPRWNQLDTLRLYKAKE